MASISTILNGRNTDSKSHTNRSAGRSLPEVPPERLRGERALTKSAYPLKTSRSQNSSFSFSYPETISVKEESGFGISKVEASATDSLIVIIVAYPEGLTTPDQAAKDLFTEVGRGVRDEGAKLATDEVTAIKRSIGGKTYEFVQMPYTLLGMDMVYEVAGFEKNGSTVVWFIQHAKEDKESAEASIRIMADSFQ